MKIHLACGKHILDGWVNCDIEKHVQATRAPDILCDVSSVPLEDGCAIELLSVHILEHFYQWEVAGVLKEWARLLESGGKIVIEMPDIYKAAKNILSGDSEQMNMWAIYGDQTLKNPLMCHKWGWTFRTIEPLLKQAGFRNIQEKPTEWHGRRQNRDFRVEAIKC